MKFIVPFKAHSKRAKTKAQLMLEYDHRDVIGGRDPIKPATGYDTVTFEAHTFGVAMQKAQVLILSGDNRPLQGRTNIKWFKALEETK
jgi:hypothetical protein